MISKIVGKLVQKEEQAVTIDVNGLHYTVMVPKSVVERIDQTVGEDGNVALITYYYFQIGPASGFPIMIGFINELEREFFQQFIKVSGIGPRAAVRALNKPISEITQAIDSGDVKYLKTLPGIGMQRAKEVVAKLQGKVSKFGLIQDKSSTTVVKEIVVDWQEEALSVLLQLQYKKNEAENMIDKALKRSEGIKTTEELLNEIYKQKVAI